MKAMFIAIAIALTGCSGFDGVRMRTNAFNETITPGAQTAKARVSTNGTVALIPNRDCLDYLALGAGVVATAKPHLYNHLNDKREHMDGTLPPNMLHSEVIIEANKPHVVVFDDRREILNGSIWCKQMAYSFIPKEGAQYQITGDLDEKEKRCWVNVRTIQPANEAVKMTKADACQSGQQRNDTITSNTPTQPLQPILDQRNYAQISASSGALLAEISVSPNESCSGFESIFNEPTFGLTAKCSQASMRTQLKTQAVAKMKNRTINASFINNETCKTLMAIFKESGADIALDCSPI